ncbi:PTS system cellobiose/salicin/arbutin-specific transporter subunit IIBC [Klebsiella pneumoniae]|uniref:PTS system cellobiose/salicin/arbutin-specific transporter subunit IIBC n=1 Tax=Klebsiella pneumoniae TaxID=573 RepID=A0A378F4Y4_KLEPN|nr:PTS system cellobiose/salicin/arbutin-specific transporter subunit IIBC [Klebsiella pneumoniae]STR92785.1 PTS system cellobiose/salicin/arbutin-specific transporter subunit IIBC [Klebsiella pneumoniae]STS12591.1 PTS system cellobiose/salicin/arbutin-specific transporter subunit IIBC [Klebsiella pneumoniae]STS19966.1 PTS system cellobiose/salicin/arbutin-specific transporter subunit IIBC [Klebsiella pneumoniae]STS23611.1 PTS system cellobiose/salicin/arbutin-specific transporter subunit IIBC 
MVKRQTIALLASEEQVPLVLTARQQALVDAVANRMLTAERNPVSPVGKPRAMPGRGPDRAEAADRDGQNAR